jgi:hypothetical protein
MTTAPNKLEEFLAAPAGMRIKFMSAADATSESRQGDMHHLK